MSIAPIPCAHCGFNFMRHNLDENAPKLCNNCLLRAEKNQPKGEKPMSKASFLIECDRKDQIDIEEKCTNDGITISDYFMRLHHGLNENVQCNHTLQKQVEAAKELANTPFVDNKKSKGAKK